MDTLYNIKEFQELKYTQQVPKAVFQSKGFNDNMQIGQIKLKVIHFLTT